MFTARASSQCAKSTQCEVSCTVNLMNTTCTRRTRRRAHNLTHDSHRCLASGKIRYRDKLEATTALHIAVSRRCTANAMRLTTNRCEQRSYFCESCVGFHLTSQAAR